MALQFRFSCRTDVGAVREKNEDCIDVCPELRLAVLADGMGGYNAGEVASAIATSVIREEVRRHLTRYAVQDQPARSPSAPVPADILADAVRRANDSILNAAAAQPCYLGMGTTVVAVLFDQSHATFAHVGDSRAYRLRNRQLLQLTRDHSLLQEQIDAGVLAPDSAQAAQYRHLLTRALGVEPELMVDINQYDVQPGDVFLLCSDGLHDLLTREEIAAILDPEFVSLETAAKLLIEGALMNGGFDNVSVILAEAGSEAQ